jgi:hypothetical protein
MFRGTFVQDVILLLLTAVLTGFLVPYVLKKIDDRRSARQKDHEATMARQAKIIDAQSTVLDDLSKQLWRWRYLSIRLTYYGGEGIQDRFDKAEEEYDRDIWEIFNHVRNEISRSRRLVSEQVYQQLVKFYKEDVVDLDRKITSARGADNVAAAFHDLNEYIFENVTARIDQVLDDVADEMKLKGQSSF